MFRTIHDSAEELHQALCEYIEAVYHIASPELLRARRRLLSTAGNVRQVPFLETTPRYVAGSPFSEIDGVPGQVKNLFEALSKPRTADGLRPILFDPPYDHQAKALHWSVGKGKNLVIMTGTGSGKTESFLMPILAGLAREASTRPTSFKKPAVRAMLLYPMNALVNDQLGRLRGIFSDPRVKEQFSSWAGTVPTFARYTSRTPYAGVRDGKKDDKRLKSFSDFYVEIETAAETASAEGKKAKSLMSQLRSKGKWPSKPSLSAWYGTPGTSWKRRANTLPADSELITRHEAQKTAPDLLVTNYSMLEYMLMRPIERSIFDQTRDWLAENPNEKFLVVLDEAHLYRGSAGAEVGLLIRRLTDRLGIGPERLQAVCATASFGSRENAVMFASELTGCSIESFEPISGTLALQESAGVGTLEEAKVLAAIDIAKLNSDDEAARIKEIELLLNLRGIAPTGDVDECLYRALKDYPALAKATNLTMGAAKPLATLPDALFPGVPEALAKHATSNLLNLGSRAKAPGMPGLIPCRVHTFFRGLPGLWACMDPNCSAVSEEERNPYCGKLYSQPRDRCECEACCLELYTCRHCGSPYARAYSNNIDEPGALWREPGAIVQLAGTLTSPLQPLDLLLQVPSRDADPADYDLETGRLNAFDTGPRSRRVYIRADRAAISTDEDDAHQSNEARGAFMPCGVCGGRAGGNRSSVQDHMTKGDQPFQALVSKQIQIQAEGPETNDEFAPLRGRKVLVFSDSRQVAARLAPNLQTYSMRDVLRPLLMHGLATLQASPTVGARTTLDDIYFATLLAAKQLNVRLRPELQSGESFGVFQAIGSCIGKAGVDLADDVLFDCWLENRSASPPAAMLEELVTVLADKFTGLEALALASLRERPTKSKALAAKLAKIPNFASTEDEKISLVRYWLRCWTGKRIWIQGMPEAWWNARVVGHNGQFKALDRILPDKHAKSLFKSAWLPVLLGEFTESIGGLFSLRGKNLAVFTDGGWYRCNSCTSVHRRVARYVRCVECGHTDVVAIDADTDEVFRARKGFYRSPVLSIMQSPPVVPLALVAAEHTAQLNSQNEDAFSKAERNELLFQDIDISWKDLGDKPVAIDILSSTTTMEVGIDIGTLSGVALRNMPPGRANYQQRAGRAGRRGNCVATVVAFGSVDSHDEHYFESPEEMISGPVVDPRLTLENPDLARRHLRAYLLQAYHRDRLPVVSSDESPDLFSVLGRVGTFRDGSATLNRKDLGDWLAENQEQLSEGVRKWLPGQLPPGVRDALISEMVSDCLESIDRAIAPRQADGPTSKLSSKPKPAGDAPYPLDVDPDVEEPVAPKSDEDKLLDRLLFEGVLPRYAFPTDVVTFHVFDAERSSAFRHTDAYSPAQGLPIALSQYAPGKQVWVAGKCYTSGAVYSPIRQDRVDAWERRKYYFECEVCHFADTLDSAESDSTQTCPACKSPGTFGPGRAWMRPVGFAHPIDLPEETSPDRVPESSYATRAKLTMRTPGSDAEWNMSSARFGALARRTHLLVSNTGPKNRGYSYCKSCGRIEASTEPQPALAGQHAKPFPTKPGDSICRGNVHLEVVLGGTFVTDVALMTLRVEPPMNLSPSSYATSVALRTLCEAFARASASMLEIEPGEIAAEFRPSMSAETDSSLSAEVFLYDTLPGGAGFSSGITLRTAELLNRAQKILEVCPENCDSSCYRCLRSFGNRFEHRSLDRHVGAELLGYLRSGNIPQFDKERIAKSSRRLFDDLVRLDDGSGEFSFEMNSEVVVGGKSIRIPICAIGKSGSKVAVGLSGALTDGHAADTELRELAQMDPKFRVILVNELLVRKNLPTATQFVLDSLQK